MAIDIFWYYASTLAFACVFGALLCVYRYYLGNRLIANANKLKSQIANIRRDIPELAENRNQIVGSAIGAIGIDGLLDELGIDPGILKNPVVKGLIDRYAPRVLEQLSKGGKNATNGQTGETALL